MQAEQIATVAGRGTDDLPGWRKPVAHLRAKMRRTSSVTHNMTSHTICHTQHDVTHNMTSDEVLLIFALKWATGFLQPDVSRLHNRRTVRDRIRAVRRRAKPACLSVSVSSLDQQPCPQCRLAGQVYSVLAVIAVNTVAQQVSFKVLSSQRWHGWSRLSQTSLSYCVDDKSTLGSASLYLTAAVIEIWLNRSCIQV